jgi:transcription elongation factor GreA
MVTNNTNVSISLGEAVGKYLAVLPDEKKNAAQQEINNFIRWYGGREKTLDALEGSAVGNYAERLAKTDAACVQKLDLVRGFLTYAHKQHWCKENLSVSIRVVKKAQSKTTSSSSKKKTQKKDATCMTQKAFNEIEIELKALQEKRLVVIEDIKRAAADKDFKENAPYHAAREQKSLLDGKIMELDEMISTAVIIEENLNTNTVLIGSTVILQNIDSGSECRYTLVGPREVNPAKGKISAVSPVGKAIFGKAVGDKFEVTVPSGKLHFELKVIEHSAK